MRRLAFYSNFTSYFKETFMTIVHRISHGTNVVVVSTQSSSSNFFLLFADWLFTTTFVPWDILWAVPMMLKRW